MVLGLFENKTDVSERQKLENAYNAPSAQHPEEDPLAKKPQYVQAALGAVDPKIMALGAGAGLLFGGPIGIGLVGGAAISTAINAAVAVKKEHDEVDGQRISLVDQPKNNKINFFGNGLVVGALVAAALPLSISVVPVAVATGVGMHFVGEALKSQEEKDLREAQKIAANNEVNNAVNASFLGGNNGAMASNYQTIPSQQQADYYSQSMSDSDAPVPLGKYTAANPSRKRGGANAQQQFLEQQAKEAELAKYATVS